MNTDTLTPSAPSPQRPASAARPRPGWQWPVLAPGAVLGVYLVARGIAEPFTLDWGDPASYASDWGGPRLAGVVAVHSGPALAVIAGTAWWLRRRLRGPGPGQRGRLRPGGRRKPAPGAPRTLPGGQPPGLP